MKRISVLSQTITETLTEYFPEGGEVDPRTMMKNIQELCKQV